jgi:hypothetical protein
MAVPDIDPVLLGNIGLTIVTTATSLSELTTHVSASVGILSVALEYRTTSAATWARRRRNNSCCSASCC